MVQKGGGWENGEFSPSKLWSIDGNLYKDHYLGRLALFSFNIAPDDLNSSKPVIQVMCECVHACACVCVCTYACVCVYVCTCVYWYAYVSVYVCVYLCMCVYALSNSRGPSLLNTLYEILKSQ